MGVKMNFRIITKNHEADWKIGSRQKIDLRADWTHDSLGVIAWICMNQPRKTQANERAHTVMKRAPFILKTSVLEYGLIFAS